MSVLNYSVQAYEEAKEVEGHFHTHERWCGILTTQSTVLWARFADGKIDTPFVATSGNNVYGAAIQCLGTGDTPVISGKTKFDVHRISVSAVSDTGTTFVRLTYGTGTQSAALTAGQYSEVAVFATSTGANRNSSPADVKMPRLVSGSHKVWAQALNTVNGATISFYLGVHEYDD